MGPKLTFFRGSEQGSFRRKVLLRVVPSMIVRARLRLPVLLSYCLCQILCSRYGSYSCTTAPSFSHVEMYSFLHYIYSHSHITFSWISYLASCPLASFISHNVSHTRLHTSLLISSLQSGSGQSSGTVFRPIQPRVVCTCICINRKITIKTLQGN